jgi:hypothetical protein
MLNVLNAYLAWCGRHQAGCQALATLIGALVGALMVWLVASYQIQATVKSAERTAEQNRLATEVLLMREFVSFFRSNPMLSDIHLAVTLCEKRIPLKAEHEGEQDYISWQDLNAFVGFVDALGFYWKKGVLDLDFIDHQFGALIREAYLDKDMQEYIRLLRTKAKEYKAGVEFEALAEELIKMPEHKDHVALWRGHTCD